MQMLNLNKPTMVQNMHNNSHLRSMVHWCARLMLIGCLGLGSAAAQEPSVVMKSLDDLEKRIVKVETDMGRLKKSQASSQIVEKAGARQDSALPRLSARLDSMLIRLTALESPAQPNSGLSSSAPAPASRLAQTPSATFAPPMLKAPGAKPGSSPPDSNRSDEIASLVREVKAMIEILKQGGTPQHPAPAVAAAAPPRAPSPPLPLPSSGLELKGDIQIQGERKITAAKSRNNLDDFWGRLNLGAEYNHADFQSKINIRIFPEGFGFEPLTGATFDTAGQGSLKLQSQPSSRVVINHAWAKYAAGTYRLKFGRFETLETQSSNFGNYVDLGPGGKFLTRPAVHNAVELGKVSGPFTGSALLGTNDNKLNRGFLRLYEKYAFTPKILAGIGYRANIFDRFKYENQEILQRFDLNLVLGLPSGWKGFAEAALLQVAGKKDNTPVLLGIQPFTGKALDLLSIETEFLPDRLIANKSKEWLMNVHARKIIGSLKLESGLSSDLLDPAWNAYSLGLRVTSNLKR